MKDLRVIFMGTPDFAVNILKALMENVNVVMVVSQPDAEVGRKKELKMSPVKSLAVENGIKVVTPNKIRVEYDEILEEKPDLIVTCAYGQIIPKVILDAPKYGCVNVHASLLPKYRGGAPIHHAIMNGENETGITIMYMDEGMDSGDIITEKSIPIEEDDTLDTLSEKLSSLGSKLLIETLPSIINGTANRTKQNEAEVTFAPIIKKDDELIDFNKTTKEVYDKIRALNSNPGAYFLLEEKRVNVYGENFVYKMCEVYKIGNIYKEGFSIGTTDGEVIITRLQLEGKKVMDARDFLNGIDKSRFGESKVNDRMD